MAKFVATHGVHLWDLDVQFTRDKDADVLDESGRSHARYVYETTDQKKIAGLRRIDEYGITELTAGDEPAPAAERRRAPARETKRSRKPAATRPAAPAASHGDDGATGEDAATE